MATLTPRSEQIVAMKEARGDMAACWKGFRNAAEELADVGAGSKKFNTKEKKAAIAMSLVAEIECGFTDIMKTEFLRQYKVLGAPGDFGYDTKEGKAMQGAYEWWNELCWTANQERKKEKA